MRCVSVRVTYAQPLVILICTKTMSNKNENDVVAPKYSLYMRCVCVRLHQNKRL